MGIGTDFCAIFFCTEAFIMSGASELVGKAHRSSVCFHPGQVGLQLFNGGLHVGHLFLGLSRALRLGASRVDEMALHRLGQSLPVRFTMPATAKPGVH